MASVAILFIDGLGRLHFWGLEPQTKGAHTMGQDGRLTAEPSREAAITNQNLRLEHATTDLNDAVMEAGTRFADCLSPVVNEPDEVKASQDTIGVVHADFLAAQVVEVERATRAIREIIKRCEL